MRPRPLKARLSLSWFGPSALRAPVDRLMSRGLVTSITSRGIGFRYSKDNGWPRMSNESFTSDPSSAPGLWASLETIVSSRVYEPKTPLFQCGQPRDWDLPDSPGPSSAMDVGTALAKPSWQILRGPERCWDSVRRLPMRSQSFGVALTSTEVGFVGSDTLIGFLGDHHDVCSAGGSHS